MKTIKLLILFAFLPLLCSGQNGIINLNDAEYNINYNGSGKLVALNGKASTVSFDLYFAIPDTGITILVGNTDTIFGDAFANIPIYAENNFTVDYTCDIGSDVGKDFVVNSTLADTGYHQLITKYYYQSYFIGSDTVLINVLAEIPFGSKKIMIVGNSTTGADAADTIPALLNNTTLTFVGTIGTSVLNEGYGGATWYGFNTGTHGKFFDGSKLNLQNYFATYAVDTPDIYYIRLGINDVIYSGYNESYVLGQSQILIDSILALNDTSNIIIAVPSISENTGAGWLANYPTSNQAAQNLYIKKMHTYWQAIVNKYANHAYSDRIDCSYEVLQLNRDTGYPKIDGIHSNGVHPNALGYEEIYTALSAYINRQLTEDYSPDSLTVTWIQDYDSLSWYDKTNNLSSHEVWLSCNDSAYRHVTTVSAGTDYYNLTNLYQNADYKFKIRARSGTWHSFYSDEINQHTPIVVKTDQSTPGTFTFSLLNINTETINVDWGDGNNNDYSGSGARQHTYSVAKNPYYIVISGTYTELNDITNFTLLNSEQAYGDMSKFIIPSSTESLNLQGNFTGDISGWNIPSALSTISINASEFSGDISGWDFTNLTTIQVGCGSPYLSGDLSNVNLALGTTQFYAPSQNFTGIPKGELKNLSNVIGMYFSGNNCTQAEIDEFLEYADTYFTNNTPVQDCKFLLNGTGMSAPSATGITHKSNIETLFTNERYTATIITN